MKNFTRKPCISLDEARTYITENFNESFETLWISDTLNDPMGLNMAMIVDEILKTGYMPDGFEQKSGFRIYKYNKENDILRNL